MASRSSRLSRPATNELRGSPAALVLNDLLNGSPAY
jgi:hypothetical protein